MPEANIKHDIATYGGYLINDNELLECTSGGIATALSKKVINDGGYVAGVTYSDDFRNIEYKITNKIEDLDRFKGSKYAEVKKGSIYKDVKAILDDGKYVLFFGLPCTVAAMRMFLKKDYDNFMGVELICHGPTSIKVHQQYVDYLEKKFNSKLIDFSVRRKDGIWNPSNLYAKFENGKIFKKEFYSTEYGYAFSVMAKSYCYKCQFRGDKRTGDIMLGDFWGAEESDPFWNEKGVSAILVHTQKGYNLLKSVENIKLFDTTFERIVAGNQNIIMPRIPAPNKDKFTNLFTTHDIFYATKHSKTLKMKLRNCLIKIVPQSLKPFAKKIYNKIKKGN